MRFKLILEVNKKAFGNRLPINYQYEQSAAIYKMLSRANQDYATWLHENGFQNTNGKKFKLFTFSRFHIPSRKIIREEGRIAILSDTVEWQICFYPEKSTKEFVTGLFKNQVFEIGDKKSTVQFIIKSVEVIAPPVFKETMTFTTLSPLCVLFKREDQHVDYLSLNDVRSMQLLTNGLLDRYRSYYQKMPDENWHITLLHVAGEPKPVLITIKAGTPSQTKVKGYMMTFTLQAPVALMKFMYDAGLGNLCSQGFGCLKAVEEKTPQL